MDQGDNDSGDNIFATYPFSWVLVPLIIFVGAGTLLICYRYRRRQKLRARYGTNALERDLEAMGNHPRPRPPNERRRGLYLMFGSREEGLNELGEAPPAYTAPKRPEDTEGVELTPIPHPTSSTATEGAGTSRLPAYDELHQETNRSQSTAPTSAPDLPEPPPRAVLSSN
ncbi:hypothetical protein F4819DRAFT_458589 [Hypoxylon fuscum]|nr:hypothetical protein F4819DRAFT_458589 [Hypoxylon fuscum]